MEQQNRTRSLLLTHLRQYPGLQMQDVFKFLHQSAFGCEHLVTDEPLAASRIAEEYAAQGCGGTQAVEALDGAYGRVSLAWLERGLRAETLAKLFVASAKKEDGAEALGEKLNIAAALVKEGALPFSLAEFEKAAAAWAADGYPALHHSQTFREAYRPAYRVIAKEYLPFLPLLAAIDGRGGTPTVVAVEGGSASGKTTLSRLLAGIYDCTVFHMDDFFLRPEQRTPQRFAEVGGNVDRERVLAEILQPMRRGEGITYRKFDCATMSLGEAETVTPKNLVIVEGAYSMHPELAQYYDLSAFLQISPEQQRQRILKRNGAMAQRFFTEWIPLENRYFEATDIIHRCNLVIPAE